jgi:hypothetical protein
VGASVQEALQHDRPNRHLPQDDLGNGPFPARGHSLKFRRFWGLGRALLRLRLYNWKPPTLRQQNQLLVESLDDILSK